MSFNMSIAQLCMCFCCYVQDWAARLQHVSSQVQGPIYFLWGTDWEDAPIINARALYKALPPELQYDYISLVKQAAAGKGSIQAFVSTAAKQSTTPDSNQPHRIAHPPPPPPPQQQFFQHEAQTQQHATGRAAKRPRLSSMSACDDDDKSADHMDAHHPGGDKGHQQQAAHDSSNHSCELANADTVLSTSNQHADQSDECRHNQTAQCQLPHLPGNGEGCGATAAVTGTNEALAGTSFDMHNATSLSVPAAAANVVKPGNALVDPVVGVECTAVHRIAPHAAVVRSGMKPMTLYFRKA